MKKLNKDTLKNINGGIVFVSYIDCPLENDISEKNQIIAILYIDDKDNVCQGILVAEDLLKKKQILETFLLQIFMIYL